MQGQAADLGSSWLHTGDLDYSRKQLEAARAVNPDSLQDVAKRYLTTENQTLYALTPAGSTPKPKPRVTARRATGVEKIELPNGLRLLLKKDNRLPFTHFRAGLLGGVLSETSANSGLTRLMSRTMLKGTAKRNASVIASEIESAGGSIDTYSGNNSFGLSLDILSDDAALAQAVFLDVLLSPAFDSGEIERERTSQLAAIEQQRDHLLSHTLRKLRSLLFGDTGYGLDSLGQAPVVTSLSREQIAGHHNTLAAPANAVMAVFGDIDSAQVREQVEAALAKWNPPAPSLALPEAIPLSEAKRDSVSTEKRTGSRHAWLSGLHTEPPRSLRDGSDLRGVERHGLAVVPENSRGTRAGLLRRHAELRGANPRLLHLYAGTGRRVGRPGRRGVDQPSQAPGQGGAHRR